jgi:hypothetical protein
MPPADNLVTTRQAAQILAARVAGFEPARQLLRCGAAGPGVRVGSAIAYDEARVHALALRPSVDRSRLAEACPRGVHVARVARGRTVDALGSWDARAEALAEQRPVTMWTAAWLVLETHGAATIPWVATVSGYVVLAAEMHGWRPGGGGPPLFDLRPPGPWSDHVDRRWFRLRPGRPWFFWDPTRLPQ